MREIFFRGKHTSGHWICGMYVAEGYQADFPCILPHYDSASNGWANFEVDPATVGQYTGLTDQNGKKIFEGDILAAHFDDLYPENVTIVTVVWDENGFYTKQGNMPLDLIYAEDCGLWEVIGNIYDNPELMEVSG